MLFVEKLQKLLWYASGGH